MECSFISVAEALLLAGDLDSLRDFMAHSIAGASVGDEAMRAGIRAVFEGMWGWEAEGFCHGTVETWLLMPRGVAAVLEKEMDDAGRAALREWLPPPAELLYIAEHETAWACFATGAVHPALLCARLHGERLGEWATTVEVAEGVLRVTPFNPIVRSEAYRLLGRARAALGQRAVACEAAESAATEAVNARYVWLEMLSLRDLLEWSEVEAAKGVRLRLGGVLRRVAATHEELVGVLGEGDWADAKAEAEAEAEAQAYIDTYSA